MDGVSMNNWRAFNLAYLLGLALLPWSWLPPFPWLHEHAQWSDALFALAAAAWVMERSRHGGWPRLRPHHAAMGFYLAWAVVSHLAAGLEPAQGRFKLLGMAELLALAVMTEDLASRTGGLPQIARTFAWTSLATGIAALAGTALFHAGIATPLLSHAGDLEPGNYARARAGLFSPNLLASYAIVANGIVGHPEARLPAGLRRAAQAALGVAVLLSMARGILGFVLAALVRHGARPSGRRLSAAWALASALVLAALTVWTLSLDPTRPWRAHLRDDASSRWAALTSSAETLARHPWTGTGPATLPGSRYGVGCDAHSTALNVAATLGLPALLAFAAVPLLLWRSRARPTDLAVWGALAGVGLDALAQDVEDFRHVWILFGLAAAGRREPVVASAHR
jgi:hypothetical protein